jgi:hypothetical protein
MRDRRFLDKLHDAMPDLRHDPLHEIVSRSIELNVQPPPRTGGGTWFPNTGTGSGTGGGGAGAAPASDAATAGKAGGAASVGNLLPWLYPTADFLNLDKGPGTGLSSGPGAVAIPAIGTTVIILAFKVPRGRNGKITQLGIDFIANGGAVYNQGIVPAPLTFSISTDQKGYAFADYEQFQYSPGAVSAPTPINGLMIKEDQTIFVKVTNNTIVVTTQFLAARVLGYLYSKNLEPKMLAYQ